MTNYQISMPMPQADESFERYAIRTHREISKAVTDPEERNLLIEEVWREHRGATEAEQMAADRLGDPDKFIRKPNICLFTEHETTDQQGQPRKYDLPKLVKIVRNANHRIADVAAFPAISDGHTPAPGTENAKEPDVLGYVGNYRLGMIGRKNPRWAIFADEFHKVDRSDQLSSKPRRSVELWTFKDTGKSHFDPIAALGSEAPRLPLPVQFQLMREGGAEVEKYQVAAPTAASAVFPGGVNTSPKSFKDEEPEKMALSDEDVAMLVGAIAETPQWKWLDRQMKADAAEETAEVSGDILPEQNEMEAPVAEEAADVVEEAAEVPAAVAEEAVEEAADEYANDEDLADLSDLLMTPAEGAPPPEEEEETERMSAQNANATLVERYSALSASHNKLIAEHGELRKQVTKLRHQGADGHRKAKLMELANKFPTAVVLEEELQTCLYSSGSQMNDAQFLEHVATVEKYAGRSAPVSPMIPDGVMPQSEGEREDYQALSQRAVELCTAAQDRGDQMTWDEGLAAARKELAL